MKVMVVAGKNNKQYLICYGIPPGGAESVTRQDESFNFFLLSQMYSSGWQRGNIFTNTITLFSACSFLTISVFAFYLKFDGIIFVNQ
jgi:hypothetical protein